MAAAAFGLFLLVFQALGVFSILTPEEERLEYLYGRWNLKDILKPGNYRSFNNVKRFYLDRFHRIPIVDKNFNYQIFPSNWVHNEEKDSTTENSRGTLVKSAGSSSPVTVPSWEKTIDYYRRERAGWRRGHQSPNSTPGNTDTIAQTSVSRPVSENLIQHSDESKNEISLILDTENAFFQNNISMNDFHKEKITNENIPVENETGKNANIQDKANDIISVDEKGKGNKTVEEAVENKGKQTTAVEEVTTVNKEEDERTTTATGELKEEEKETTVVKDTINSTTSVEDREKGNTIVKETVEITTVVEEVDKNTTDVKPDDETTSAEKITDSPIPITSDESENSTGAISERGNSSESNLDKTTSADRNTRGVTKSDDSSSGKIQSTTIQSISTTFSSSSETASKKNIDGSTNGIQSTSTYIKYEVTSDDLVTDSISIIPEHIINIRTIKTAKIVLATLLLVTCLIGVAILAACVFRVKRRAVQYDQLTLLP